ncbi:MAG: hypothetical protein AAF488_17235 [Planctomycetota bacterium]
MELLVPFGSLQIEGRSGLHQLVVNDQALPDLADSISQLRVARADPESLGFHLPHDEVDRFVGAHLEETSVLRPLEPLERARERGDTRELRLMHADALRLTKATLPALEAYTALVEEPEDAATPRCYVELAKLHEHALADVARALECCERSRAALERTLTGTGRARLLRELERREARLAAKARP